MEYQIGVEIMAGYGTKYYRGPRKEPVTLVVLKKEFCLFLYTSHLNNNTVQLL